MVEVWFGNIERQAVDCGTFRSARELTTKICEFFRGWNLRSAPFVWTETADQILVKARRPSRADRRDPPAPVMRFGSHPPMRSSTPRHPR
ncbi:hypothetical protein ACIGO9_30215 [Nocardia asteroides]|uniref:hypothetical protein n=1 Tax=Nocardia asteroides TaxID=1824 RepID=UPI0037CB1ABB